MWFVMLSHAPIREILQRHLPAAAQPYVGDVLAGRDVVIRVSRPRLSKLGDHRPPRRGDCRHRISVNGDLNPYAFLTTLLHEIAHMDVWERHAARWRRPKPHGREWKAAFGTLLGPVVTEGWLPGDVAEALASSMRNPAAMSCSDRGLVLALARYDDCGVSRTRVEDVPLGGVFRTANGRVFCRGQQVRTRYCCIEHGTGIEYRVHALACVEVMAALPPMATAGPQAAARRRGSCAGGPCSRRRAAGDRAASRSACS